MILITGASGNVGRAVVEQMRTTGVPLRGLYRSSREAERAPAGVTPVIGDFADPASLRAALDGVTTVFLVCAPIPQLVELETNVIRTARDCGVRHIVLNSALGAGDYPRSFPSWHRQVEEHLSSSGIDYTILRPNSFLQNILAYMAPGIRAQGAFYAATGPARFSYLDIRDIARVAARIMAAPAGHSGRTYELNGPEALSNAELARRISRASGRLVEFVDIPEEAQRKAMTDLGMPAWQVEALLGLQAYYTGGKGGEVTGTLPQLLGAEPVGVDAFLSEFRDEFAAIDPLMGMTIPEAKRFVREHFDAFVNRKNLDVADVNFAPEFVDRGTDVPPGLPPGPAGAKAYVGAALQRIPDLRVEILDVIAEGDKVVVRNRWQGTDAASGRTIDFSGIVIWRIRHRQLVERWAYLTQPART